MHVLVAVAQRYPLLVVVATIAALVLLVVAIDWFVGRAEAEDPR